MILKLDSVAAHLEAAVRDFTDVAVVGISGGVDSAVVASICVAALGKANVRLVSMPYDDTDAKSFNARSHELAVSLDAPHHVVSISAMCTPLESALGSIFEGSLDQLTPANIRPRVRMNVLYAICGELGYRSSKRARVMGTGHMSEDLIGYDTKGGDALCDIFILSDLVKSEVYQLARHYEVPESIINAAPSAGLYDGQTDEDELGYSYTALEPATLVLNALLRGQVAPAELSPSDPAFANVSAEHARFVVERYQRHHHKHEAPVTVSTRRPGWMAPV